LASVVLESGSELAHIGMMQAQCIG